MRHVNGTSDPSGWLHPMIVPMSWLDTLEDIRKKDFSKVPMKDRDKAARDVVNLGSYACAVVAVSPIPFSDAVLMLPVQSAMVITVGHVYGRKLTQADAKSLVLELGATAGIGLLARQGIKALLPVVGALLTVPAAFAMNWAIGRVAIEYFRNPDMTRDQLKQVFENAKAEGAKLFSRERFDAFRKSKAAPKEEAAWVKKGKKKKKAKAEAEPELSAVEAIVEVDFAARLKKHPDVREAIDGILHLAISGGDGGEWTIDLTRPSKWISRGLSGKPKLKISCSAKTFTAMLERRQTATTAVMSGDLELEPMNIDLAMKLGPLFA